MLYGIVNYAIDKLYKSPTLEPKAVQAEVLTPPKVPYVCYVKYYEVDDMDIEVDNDVMVSTPNGMQFNKKALDGLSLPNHFGTDGAIRKVDDENMVYPKEEGVKVYEALIHYNKQYRNLYVKLKDKDSGRFVRFEVQNTSYDYDYVPSFYGSTPYSLLEEVMTKIEQGLLHTEIKAYYAAKSAYDVQEFKRGHDEAPKNVKPKFIDNAAIVITASLVCMAIMGGIAGTALSTAAIFVERDELFQTIFGLDHKIGTTIVMLAAAFVGAVIGAIIMKCCGCERLRDFFREQGGPFEEFTGKFIGFAMLSMTAATVVLMTMQDQLEQDARIGITAGLLGFALVAAIIATALCRGPEPVEYV